MSKEHDNLEKATELLKHVAQSPETVTLTEKRLIKKLIGGDLPLLVDALISDLKL